MVKLVDTLDLGSSAFGVGVQVPLRAPTTTLDEPEAIKKPSWQRTKVPDVIGTQYTNSIESLLFDKRSIFEN